MIRFSSENVSGSTGSCQSGFAAPGFASHSLLVLGCTLLAIPLVPYCFQPANSRLISGCRFSLRKEATTGNTSAVRRLYSFQNSIIILVYRHSNSRFGDFLLISAVSDVKRSGKLKNLSTYCHTNNKMTGRSAAKQNVRKRRDNYSQSPVSLARFCSPTEVKFPVLDKRERKMAMTNFFCYPYFLCKVTARET